MPPDPVERARQGGFTLLEVLVAFAIAGLALAVLFQGALSGLRAAGVAGQYQEALARARSHLAALGAVPQPGDLQGEDGGGFHWHTRVTPAGTLLVGGAQAPARTTLYRVEVSVSWQAGAWGTAETTRSVRLATARLHTAPPGAAPP